MNVYEIKSNFDEFLYLIHETQDDYIATLDKEGESFKQWVEPTWVIYYPKTKKERKGKREDFNASCFFNGILLIWEDLAKKMINEFDVTAELLLINTPEIKEKFVFVNILGGIPAITQSFWYSSYELWAAEHMPKSLTKPVFPQLQGKFAFDKEILMRNPVFRDKKFNNCYFCTDTFVQWAKANDIKGLRFENAGIVR
ncbi:MAG: hypothetical protein Q3971_01325 [Moraxella sp.]|nr:hypothetical protein [Moraxella sp.]